MPSRSLMRPAWASRKDETGRRFSSRHFLKLVEDAIDLGFWWGDLAAGDQIEASVGLYRVFGLDPSIRLTFGFAKTMMHPEDQARHVDLLPLLRGGQPILREFRIVRPDRTQRWVSHRVEVLVDADGKPAQALGMVEDVTARYEVRTTVEQGNDRFKALLEATAAVVWIASPDGKVVDMPQWQALTGQSHLDCQGLGWIEAIHPEDRPRTASAWQTALSHHTGYNTDYRLLCMDGIYRWYNARGTPILNRDGSVREWIGVCLNIPGSSRFPGASPPQGSGGSDDGRLREITVEQLRAARGMTGLSAEEVARRAGVSVSTVRRLEDAATAVHARRDTLLAVRQALEDAGVAFTFDANVKPGVRPA